VWARPAAAAQSQWVAAHRNIRQRAFSCTRLVADTMEKDTLHRLNVQF
jgi:hypothetical protein